MDSVIQRLSNKIPHRKVQISELYELIGHKDEHLPASIFINGPSSCGKSYIITTLLKFININHVIVNPIECYSNKVLFETILNKLHGHVLSRESNYKPYYKCETSLDFLSGIQDCGERETLVPFVIVLEQAEKLRNNEVLLSVFLRLQELSNIQLCVIFVSDIVFDNFFPVSLKPPITLHFPQYTKEELLDILLRDYKHVQLYVTFQTQDLFDMKEDFYKNYLNILLSVFYRVCRDLSELKYLAKMHILEYCQPIISKQLNENDVMKLWRYMGPYFKKTLETVYLRINATADQTTPCPFEQCTANILKKLTLTDDHNVDLVTGPIAMPAKELSQTVELPYYSKYLLIAAYLASYNPPKEDKRLFMKSHGKKRKTKQQIAAKCKVFEKMNMQLGPKSFTLDRLLAIFYAIINEQVGLTSNLLVQLSSLVDLKFLMRIGNESQLNGHKYKCIVEFNCIESIAKMVNFNIKKYLYDLI